MLEKPALQKSGYFRGFSGGFQVEKGIFKSPLLFPDPLPSFNTSSQAVRPSEQLKTTHCTAKAFARSFVDSVLPVPVVSRAKG